VSLSFSIVIPLYNKERCIGRTLQSVLGQTYPSFEVVVVDDGSTDGSAEVVRAIEDGRIRLIEKENGGVCSARNRGIMESKYDYVAFLDADDCYDSEFLAEQVKLIEEFPNAAMWGVNFAELYEGKLIHRLPTGLPVGYRGIVSDYFTMPGRVSDLFCSSSVVIRKSAFDVAGMFDERIRYSEDIDMWYRIILSFPVVFYDRYLAYYYYDAENRAMNRPVQLKYFLPYYVDKYDVYRERRDFYRFIYRWSAVHIKRYYFNDESQREDALCALQKLDYSVLPLKYWFFFKLPFRMAKVLYLLSERRLNRKHCR